MKKRTLMFFSLGIAISLLGSGCQSQQAANDSTEAVVTEAVARETVVQEAKVKEPITQETVQLSAGSLIGYKEGSVYNFKGIPYATAERFQDPLPVETYEGGTRMALSYGPVAPQSRTLSSTAEPNIVEMLTPSNGTADMVGNENCQYLNVWTNDLGANKPVIVFFHGGGLSSGASSELSTYTGEYFAETENAVFVSVNHRLNILGYLDLSAYGEEYKDSGMAGLRDCVLALQWVQNNIAQFGGNPKNVTIIGQSGGGHKVSTLACMSDTVGLFDKVVSMSGYYNSLTKEDGLANTKLLVDYLGLSEEEIVPTLTSMSYEELYNASTAAGCSWDTARYGNSTYETPLFDENGNMNEYAAQRKWMIGTVYGEVRATNGSRLIRNDQSCNLSNIDDQQAMERLTEAYGENAARVAETYKAAYPNHSLAESLFIDGGIGRISRGELIAEDNGFLKLFNDAGVNVYNYVVGYKMPYFGGITMYHTGDMPFWFNSLDEVPYMIRGDEENAYHVAQEMADALTAFATTGDPSTGALSWKSYSTDEHNTMVFDTTSECKTDFDKEFYDLLLQSAE